MSSSQQRKFRNYDERKKIKDQVLMAAYENDISDEIAKQLGGVLDKFMESTGGQIFHGQIPLNGQRVIQYALPGRRIHQPVVKVTNAQVESDKNDNKRKRVSTNNSLAPGQPELVMVDENMNVVETIANV